MTHDHRAHLTELLATAHIVTGGRQPSRAAMRATPHPALRLMPHASVFALEFGSWDAAWHGAAPRAAELARTLDAAQAAQRLRALLGDRGLDRGDLEAGRTLLEGVRSRFASDPWRDPHFSAHAEDELAALQAAALAPRETLLAGAGDRERAALLVSTLEDIALHRGLRLGARQMLETLTGGVPWTPLLGEDDSPAARGRVIAAVLTALATPEGMDPAEVDTETLRRRLQNLRTLLDVTPAPGAPGAPGEGRPRHALLGHFIRRVRERFGVTLTYSAASALDGAARGIEIYGTTRAGAVIKTLGVEGHTIYALLQRDDAGALTLTTAYTETMIARHAAPRWDDGADAAALSAPAP